MCKIETHSFHCAIKTKQSVSLVLYVSQPMSFISIVFRQGAVQQTVNFDSTELSQPLSFFVNKIAPHVPWKHFTLGKHNAQGQMVDQMTVQSTNFNFAVLSDLCNLKRIYPTLGESYSFTFQAL